jgi:hypothetical protein
LAPPPDLPMLPSASWTMQAARTLLMPMLDCSNLVDADAGLRKAHAPDERARSQIGDHLCDLPDLVGRRPSDTLGFLGRPGFDLLADVVEAPYAFGDVVLIFPAVRQDFVQDTP